MDYVNKITQVFSSGSRMAQEEYEVGLQIYHTNWKYLKALVFTYAFEESVDYHLLSSFCDDSNLHISLFKYVLSTMGVGKESISKCLIGNRFHVKLRILSPFYLYKDWGCVILREIDFLFKNLLIDSLLTSIVESTYLNRDLLQLGLLFIVSDRIYSTFTLKTQLIVLRLSK